MVGFNNFIRIFHKIYLLKGSIGLVQNGKIYSYYHKIFISLAIIKLQSIAFLNYNIMKYD